MAEGYGGKRTPRNPAPVSGPGQLSRRTDGGPAQVNAQMTGMAYGENKDFMEIQDGAAMAASPKSRGAAKVPQGSPAGPMIGGGSNPLFSDTMRPDEPVTAGANFGPGASGAPQLNSTQMATADAEAISKYLPDLMKMAEEENTPAAFKRFVRHLRNTQGA
jgi:hypothetical protein